MRRAIVVGLFLLLACLPGCGGGGEKEGLPAGAPRPAEPLSAAVRQFERAAAHPTCAAIDPLVPSQNRQGNLGEPLTARECRTLKQRFEAELAHFKASGTATMGTAGIADGVVGGQSQAAVFVLDVDRRWKLAFAIPAGRQVGTSPEDSGAFDDSADRFVRATRERSCSSLFAVTSISSPGYQSSKGSKGELCRASLRPRSPGTFVAQIRRDGSAKPVRMGTTRDFAFYGISLNTGRYDTIVMITQPGTATPAELQGKAKYAFYELYNARPPRR